MLRPSFKFVFTCAFIVFHLQRVFAGLDMHSIEAAYSRLADAARSSLAEEDALRRSLGTMVTGFVGIQFVDATGPDIIRRSEANLKTFLYASLIGDIHKLAWSVNRVALTDRKAILGQLCQRFQIVLAIYPISEFPDTTEEVDVIQALVPALGACKNAKQLIQARLQHVAADRQRPLLILLASLGDTEAITAISNDKGSANICLKLSTLVELLRRQFAETCGEWRESVAN